MNAINTRIAHYCQHLLHAEIVMTPPPRSSQEVAFILGSFRSLAQVESFKFNRSIPKMAGYGSVLSICFNASAQRSLMQLALLHNHEQSVSDCTWESSQAMALRREALVKSLEHIIAIPRYSFLEGDEAYSQDLLLARFKHRLVSSGLRFDGQYTITDARASDPFCRVVPEPGHENSLDIDLLRKSIRHNFQKFHKFQAINLTLNNQRNAEAIPGLNYEKLVMLNQKYTA